MLTLCVGDRYNVIVYYVKFIYPQDDSKGMRDRKQQKSKDFVLNLNEIDMVMKYIDDYKLNIEKFIFVCLTYGGFRVSELSHMRRSWIHVNDEYTKQLNVNFIQIPEKGEYCDCRDCKLQHFLEEEVKKGGVKYTKQWYQEIRKNLDYDKLEGRYWQPKTPSGVRKIPIVYDIFQNEVIRFYTNKDKLGRTRYGVWNIINRLSDNIWGSKEVFNSKKDKHERVLNRKLYPHALRATAASLWALKGINATALKSIMGWSNIEIADIYVKSDEAQALLTAKNIAEKNRSITNPEQVFVKEARISRL